MHERRLRRDAGCRLLSEQSSRCRQLVAPDRTRPSRDTRCRRLVFVTRNQTSCQRSGTHAQCQRGDIHTH